jgi:TRAP transporter 4TM/12TM fusion protein
VLGAAAFLIAEFLKISYLDVLLMATIPTILFYFALFLMVEIDARKFAMKRVRIDKADTMLGLTRRFGFHFLSLVAIIGFMLLGFSPLASVFWATVTAFVVSFLHPDCALIPYDVFLGRGPILNQLRSSGLRKALEGGSIGVLNVAATCAAAGLIVGVVTLTGLGLKFSSIVLGYAAGLTGMVTNALAAVGVAITTTLIHDVRLLWTAIFTSLIVWIVGLAVPVTASYIICAVIAAPALIKLDVAPFAAHMFIFYYAVLSEVSPPTALSPFAAAAITGGDPYKTTLQSWKYTMPAFLVPFIFVLDPAGLGLLLMGSFKALAAASVVEIATVCVTAMIGIAALAAGVQGWMFRKTTGIERWLLILAGLALVYPRAAFDYIGFVLIAIVLVSQKFRSRESHATA